MGFVHRSHSFSWLIIPLLRELSFCMDNALTWDVKSSSALWREIFSPLSQNYAKAAHLREFYALCAHADWQILPSHNADGLWMSHLLLIQSYFQGLMRRKKKADADGLWMSRLLPIQSYFQGLMRRKKKVGSCQNKPSAVQSCFLLVYPIFSYKGYASNGRSKLVSYCKIFRFQFCFLVLVSNLMI
ncbi:hypothetical protein BT93_G0870 [Corymbia citriodora subsp. variegata]|nr:hypothetical protein BT93_G0870 [Corymbia citriodora subsp. variegata]